MKSRIIKAIISSVLVIALIVTLSFFTPSSEPFAAEEYSETFVGFLSSNTYYSESDTAKDFLSKELTGTSSAPQYIRHETLSTLSPTEIDALSLSSFNEDTILSAQEVRVYYTCGDLELNAKFYLVEYDTGYRYFTALQEAGEPLTNSYLASVLDPDKYLNATSTTTVNVNIISQQLPSFGVSYKQIIKFANTVAHFDQQFLGMEIEMYIQETENGLKIHYKDPSSGGQFRDYEDLYGADIYLYSGSEQISLGSLSHLSEITDLMFTLNLDASCFVKTEYGFSMPEYKFQNLVYEMLGEKAYEEMMADFEKYHLSLDCKYYVSDGRLSAQWLTFSGSDGADLYSFSIVGHFTDFGKTAVTVP